MKHYPIHYPDSVTPQPNTLIILLGKPASGKGIQGRMLIEDMGYQVINMGRILKEKSTELPEIKKQMEKGILISDSLILTWIQEKLLSLLQDKQPIVIDGIPRTLVQAKGLINILSTYPHLTILAIELQVSDEIAKIRIGERRVCSKCGQSYHLTHIPPQIENKCDLCHSPLIIRQDDTLEVMENRINIYHKEIIPIRNYFLEQGIYHQINTHGLTPEQIHQTIKDLIGL